MISHTGVILMSAENTQRDEGCRSVATVQPIQNTSSGTSFVTATGTEQLHGLGTGKSSSSCRSSTSLTEQVLELPATNVAEGFESRGHALIRDISTSFNTPSYTRNGLPSVGTQSHEDLFDPSQYYNGRNPQPPENLFDPAEYYNEGHASLNTLSQQ